MNSSEVIPGQEEVARNFRLAMRELAGGVCAVSVGQGDDRGGLIATSVTSLSVEPPTLLVCVNRGASCWPLFQHYGRFGINVLASRHLDMAQHFSGKTGARGAERYAIGDWRTELTAAPILSDALVAVDCEVEEVLERHSHGIVIGRVLSVTAVQPGDALVYMRGGYAAHAGT